MIVLSLNSVHGQKWESLLQWAKQPTKIKRAGESVVSIMYLCTRYIVDTTMYLCTRKEGNPLDRGGVCGLTLRLRYESLKQFWGLAFRRKGDEGGKEVRAA